MASRRLHFLINPGFQLRMIGFFAGLGLIMSLVFYQMTSTMVKLVRDQTAKLAPDNMFADILENQLNFTMLVVLGTALFSVLLLMLGGLLLSHKIAGPIERLREEMKRIREGKPPGSFMPRKGDFFQDFYAEFNDLIEYLGKSQKK